jgi:hypothetical protein
LVAERAQAPGVREAGEGSIGSCNKMEKGVVSFTGI